jgi:hypothetical protein
MKPIEPDSLPPIKPYSLPSDVVGGSPIEREQELKDLVRGHRLLNRATLGFFLCMILSPVIFYVACASNQGDRPDIPTRAFGICLVIGYGVFVAMGIFGLLRVERGLRIHPICRIILIPAIMFPFPLLNLIVLIFLNAEATDALRAAGYRVGFLGGVSKKPGKETTADPEFTSPFPPPTGASR